MTKTSKIKEFFSIIKNARRNHNLYAYYFDKWATACGELSQTQRDLDDSKCEIKELKNKIVQLVRSNNSYSDDNLHLRAKVKNLERQIYPFRKNCFKKGNIPWNKGKKSI